MHFYTTKPETATYSYPTALWWGSTPGMAVQDYNHTARPYKSTDMKPELYTILLEAEQHKPYLSFRLMKLHFDNLNTNQANNCNLKAA